jgi:hypothetical protein
MIKVPRTSAGGGLALEKRLVSAAVAQRLFGTGEPPPTLGGYELVRRLGAGGMGVVFEARDPRTGQRVALKVLHERGFDALQRLKREFRVLLHLHHENLVELHELSVDSEQPFLTMELIDGGSLLEHVRPHGVLDADRLRDLLRQLVDAVSTLHSAGVVHRDLKPSNLLVDRDGRLVVLDFGLARAVEGDEATLPRAGTPLYMAPECWNGAPASAASDWYSVGVIAREALGFGFPVRTDETGDDARALPFHATDGARPSLDLLELCQRLCSARPNSRPTAAELRAHFGLAPAPVPSGLLGATAADRVFVGREIELEQLRGRFAQATAGQTALVYLSGEPGIGKTALANHFTAALRAQGMATVLAGACYERELIPYNAFDGVIEALGRELEVLPQAQREALRPAGATDLCRLFPSLAPRFLVEVERTAAGDPQRMRSSAFSALRELLSQLAALRPLVLQFDDLQWGDADSAQLLSALLEPAPAAPWLLIACYRGAAERSACVQALQQVRPPGSAGTHSVELGPLGRDASLSLARALSNARLDDAELARVSHEASGNPLFLRALVQHQRRHSGTDPVGRATLAHLLGSVLEQLPAPRRRLLDLAALAAEPIDRRLLLHAARLETDQTPWPEHLASLQHGGLLRRVPSAERPSLEPYHHRVREAAVGTLSPEAKARCHGWLAAAAEELNPSDHEFLAAHHEGAGQLASAALHAERAADRALESVALEHAAALYTQALRCLAGRRPPELLRKLADATAYTGRCADAVAMYLDAANAASAHDALSLRLQASEMLLRCGKVQEGREVLTPVLAAIGLRYPSSTPRALISAYASIAWAKLAPHDDTSPRRAPTEIERLRTDVCFGLGLRWGLVDPPRTCALLARGYLMARRASTDAQLARALTGYALVLAMLVPDSSREQDRALDRARALAAPLDDRESMGAVLFVRAISRFVRSEFQGTLEWIQEARRWIVEQCMDTGWFLQELDTLACCQFALLGRMAEVDRVLSESVAPIRQSGNLFQSELLDAHRGFALLAKDEPEAAIAHSARVIRTWRHHEAYQVAATGVWARFHAHLYLGDAQAAHRLVQEHWPEFSRRGYTRAQPWKCSLVLWEATVALSCAQETGDDRYLATVERAVKRLRGQRTVWSEPSWRLLEAGLAHARGQRQRAAGLYGGAADQFDALGMLNYLSAARMRQAELVDGERALALRAQAQTYFREQRIARPEPFAAMYAPIRAR